MTATVVQDDDAPFVEVEGRFFRAVRSGHEITALDGSRRPGRFSRAGDPALYLSSSRDGVGAAMRARGGTADCSILEIAVRARSVIDLRQADACRAVWIDPDEASAPWQEVLAAGGQPASWRVAERARSLGAVGLIDPSRSAPGLWHLVLFGWNQPGMPLVTRLG